MLSSPLVKREKRMTVVSFNTRQFLILSAPIFTYSLHISTKSLPELLQNENFIQEVTKLDTLGKKFQAKAAAALEETKPDPVKKTAITLTVGKVLLV